jgi:hypothetical protein
LSLKPGQYIQIEQGVVTYNSSEDKRNILKDTFALGFSGAVAAYVSYLYF